jgi:adenylate kinase
LEKVHGDAKRPGVRPLPLNYVLVLLLVQYCVIVSITGTPGTGKSSVGVVLARRGHTIIELGDLIKEHGLYDGRDEERDSLEVDTEVLNARLPALLPRGEAILLGHLSHLVTADLVIVLRCRPSVLEKRLQSRGWPAGKVRENVQAEVLDVILVEAVESGRETVEIDTTALGPHEVADGVEAILKGERKKYEIGNVDWSSEVLDWF